MVHILKFHDIYFLYFHMVLGEGFCIWGTAHCQYEKVAQFFKKRYKQAKIRKRRNQKKIPTPKTEVGKKQTNNQVLIP